LKNAEIVASGKLKSGEKMSKKINYLLFLMFALMVSGSQVFAQNIGKETESCQKEFKKKVERETNRRGNLRFSQAQVLQANRSEDTVSGTAASDDNRYNYSYNCTVNINNYKTTSVNYTVSTVGDPVTASSDLMVEYNLHLGNVGWTQQWFHDGEEGGMTGQGRNLQAIRITVPGLPGTVRYQTHIGFIGWQNWIKEGRISGTVGQSKDIQAIRIELKDCSGWSIEYSAYVTGQGWQNWVRDGEIAGTTGQNLAIEALKIRVVRR
jgi:Clostridial hydrophobic W